MDHTSGHDEDYEMLFVSDPDYEQRGHEHVQPVLPDESGQAIDQIEAIFETVADALLNERADITISLNAHSSVEFQQQDSRVRKYRFKFPGSSSAEAWRFSVILRLLELIHEAIRTGVTLTKRDLYYRDPSLFGKQATVDRYVDQIAAAFALPRASLNVTAGVKGLMAGAASLQRRDGSKIDIGNVQSGILVPSLEEILSVDLSLVRWILVIEKEATFQSILSSEAWEEMQWQAVIMTGKGYPDIATRAMAYFMTMASPQNGFAEPPIFGLMDYDPDGLAILHTYRYGPIKISGNENDNLGIPRMQWMGLRKQDIRDGDKTHQTQGLMPLTRRDRHKARKMLDWERFTNEEEANEWRQELQVMLMLNLKAEIQILDSDPGGLTNVIRNAVLHT